LSDNAPNLACVILAHRDPVQVRRLIHALDPFPVFLHCDRLTPDDVFAAMTAGLPERVTVLARLRTGWATWGVVAAELEGYRAALATTDASHLALLTGSDYPLASSAQIRAYLDTVMGRSITEIRQLPYPEWGRSGGISRLRYPHFAYRRHMIRLPIPRALPAGVRLSGGSQLKVLARHHAAAVLAVHDTRPDLVRLWRRSWIPDETFVPSVVSTPSLVPDWADMHVRGSLWYIGWDDTRQKSPPWLTSADAPTLVQARREPGDGVPRLFARKFSAEIDVGVLDTIDRSLRSESVG
jgi:hypothetical protein